MKKNRFKPIQIYVEDPVDVFQTHRMEISKAIIDSISFAIRNNKSRVDFAHIIIKHSIVIILAIESKEFLNLLDENIETLVEYEEYEVCALGMKLKKKINKKLLKNSLC